MADELALLVATGKKQERQVGMPFMQENCQAWVNEGLF